MTARCQRSELTGGAIRVDKKLTVNTSAPWISAFAGMTIRGMRLLTRRGA